MVKRVIIIGAAGRDFHDFNVLFRDNPEYQVVAFTAAQIPYISNRSYPKELSGKLYPKGIMIYDESELPSLIKKYGADICVMAYSDLPYSAVMDKASIVNAAGSDFWIIAPEKAMIKSSKPVIAVCAVRTGCGKSQTSRYIAKLLRDKGLRVVVIRHPMPYGILKDQAVQRFSKLSDLDKYNCTIEEREDYEPHIRNGFVLYSGVDYGKILKAAEKEADVILWDGGNNDAPFIKPDLMITVADPFRAGNELSYYPGDEVARMADVLLINKVNSAPKKSVHEVATNLKKINSRATILYAASEVWVDNPASVKGKKVLIIEDGPTITHGGMGIGAGTVAARKYKVSSIVDAKKYAVGEILATYKKYPRLGKELPAMGYGAKQIRDLESTVNRSKCDAVLSATPTNLNAVIKANKPIIQVHYELKPRGNDFDMIISKFASGV
jgi:predicted GTPase